MSASYAYECKFLSGPLPSQLTRREQLVYRYNYGTKMSRDSDAEVPLVEVIPNEILDNSS
jgi:hypothetical protein